MAIKYTITQEINLPKEKVVQLFDNEDNLKQWQPELREIVHLSGEPGEEGARSKLVYQMGKRQIEMEETILSNDLPDGMHLLFTTKGVKNEQSHHFSAISDGQTKWESHNIFHFSGFMAVAAFFMKGAFKKQTAKYLRRFREFAEGTKQEGGNPAPIIEGANE